MEDKEYIKLGDEKTIRLLVDLFKMNEIHLADASFAMMTLLVVAFKNNGASKKEILELVERCWNRVRSNC